jgi:hypothetical protein
VVEVVEAFEGLTVFVWILAALLRLEPKPRLLKRELMTSTAKREKRERVAFKSNSDGKCDGVASATQS